MAQYTVTLTVTSKLPSTVEKKLREVFGKDLPIHTVEKVQTARSRADRLSEAAGLVDEAKTTVDDLKGELQNWCDNLPENLRSSDKANQIEEMIQNLEQIYDSLEGCDFDSVEFPSAFGG